MGERQKQPFQLSINASLKVDFQGTRVTLRSADDWEELLLPEIERQQKLGREVVFRAEAANAQAGDLRVGGRAWRQVRPPHPGQRQPGAGHRGTTDPSGGPPEPQSCGLVQGSSLPVPVFLYAEESKLAPGWAGELARKRPDQESGFNGRPWV